MPIQSALSLVGVAKQASKGSAASNPTFVHGITDGAVVTVDIAQERESHTSGSLTASDVNRTAIMPGFGYSARAHSKSVGLYLYAALGAVSTSGSTTYTHVITPASTLPYLTTFGQMGGSNYAVTNSRVAECSIAWEDNNPVTLAVSGMGTAINLGPTFSGTTDDTYASYFTAVGGTFTLDVESSTPASAKIKSGSISINNNLDAVTVSGSITPDDVFNARREIESSFTIVPDDVTDWRAILTGTTSGTTVSGSPIYGSFSVQFTNGTDTLTIASSRVAFTAEFPSASADGGPVEIALAGIVLKPSASNEITATLVNTQASY